MGRTALPNTLAETAQALETGAWTSRALVEACLGAVETSSDARAAFLLLDSAGARAQADRSDANRRAGLHIGPFDGIPISIKDLFDVDGQVTTAGSTVLAGQPPAKGDAACLARLRQAGFIFVGRTHMTEFAYSGLGLNVHFPDPCSIWQDEGRRVPGGSSSGAAISVACGAAVAGIGTDTGGSCRIPAAFNGLVGFKPTADRILRDGCIPLSPSLDSIGHIARTVECCETLDRLLSGGQDRPTPTAGRRLLIPTNLMLDNIDGTVSAHFDYALGRLRTAGFELVHKRIAAFDMLPQLTERGGLVAIEAYRYHQSLIAETPEAYDARTLRRIRMGQQQNGDQEVELQALRARFVAAMRQELEDFAALVAPTVPVIAPLISACQSDDGYAANNLLALRNPSVVNLMDGCSISLPMNFEGARTGLMICAPSGNDRHILSLAKAVETRLA